jgi:hypothetical protein
VRGHRERRQHRDRQQVAQACHFPVTDSELLYHGQTVVLVVHKYACISTLPVWEDGGQPQSPYRRGSSGGRARRPVRAAGRQEEGPGVCSRACLRARSL